MAVILEGSALMLECAGCGELYLEGDSPARRKEGALEAWREKHTACPVVPVQLAAAAPALEDDATDLVKQLAPDLTEVHARVIAARLLERYEIPKIPGRLEAATRMVAELGAQLVRSRRLEARPGLLEELERLRAALTSACCVGCKAVLPDLETAARHVEVCMKHPLGQARARIAALEAIHEDVQELVGRILPGIDLTPYTLHGQVAMVGDHLELAREKVARLEQEACRFYRADGTFEVLPPAEVVERRILAARRLEAATRYLRTAPAEVGIVLDEAAGLPAAKLRNSTTSAPAPAPQGDAPSDYHAKDALALREMVADLFGLRETVSDDVTAYTFSKDEKRGWVVWHEDYPDEGAMDLAAPPRPEAQAPERCDSPWPVGGCDCRRCLMANVRSYYLRAVSAEAALAARPEAQDATDADPEETKP